MPSFPLDSNQVALMTARLKACRLGTFRLGAAIDPRNLTAVVIFVPVDATLGVNAWTRTRAINPDHNNPTAHDHWATVKGA
jgi:hypothetical protein